MYKVTYRYRMEKKGKPYNNSTIIMASGSTTLPTLDNMEDEIDRELEERFCNNPDVIAVALKEIIGYATWPRSLTG